MTAPPSHREAPPSADRPLHHYRGLPSAFDELIDGDRPRPALAAAVEQLLTATTDDLARQQGLAERSLLNQGVTFNVYADAKATEKIFPFCLIPRIIGAAEWSALERGLIQRLKALELFLHDVYGEQRIVEAGVVPRVMLEGAGFFLPKMVGLRPPGGTRIAIAGIDLIRDGDGVFRVLEDNLRTPSGVSYVLANRAVAKRVMPTAFEKARVHRVDTYPTRLADTLSALRPASSGGDPSVVVLTPGPYNSAYFEHSFLARTMGVDLVEADDLYVEDDRVWARTTRGPRRVDVIYRRLDDDFLDPDVFRADSLLGVRGLIRAYAAGNVTLANAPGNGVADDKAIYPFVPDMIRYYLGEEPLLAQVDTYVCLRDADRRYVVEHLDQLVVKAVDEAGGKGMLMGPQASVAERERFRALIEANPRGYIAQHLVELSTCPTIVPTADGRGTWVAPRRVDLRPYILTGPDGPWVLPGGLTRVALVEGSYVVNSSQGGGSKDTWVLKSP